MALLIDAGALCAQADADAAGHGLVAEILRREREALVTSELAAAEADYLILTRLGIDVELAFLDDLAGGTYQVECLSREELRRARAVAERYRDLNLGLSHCALVVLAERYDTRRILTFDQRAFRAVVPLQGGSFNIMPGDMSR